jgi:hypothetical protein
MKLIGVVVKWDIILERPPNIKTQDIEPRESG